MCFTVNDCKRRWKLLRDAFNRNKKQKKLPSGSAGGIIREWKYDKIMSFLLPYMQPRRLVCHLLISYLTLFIFFIFCYGQLLQNIVSVRMSTLLFVCNLKKNTYELVPIY